MSEHGARDGMRPEQSAEPSARLAPAVFLAATPVRSVSFGTPCVSPTAAERITKRSKERLLRRKTCFPPRPAPCSRSAPCPPRFLFRLRFSLSPHSAAARPTDRNARRRCRAPVGGRQGTNAPEHRALPQSRPRALVSRTRIRRGRFSSASALSGATRSAQSRTPESLATRHRPHPLSIPGRPL